MAVFQLNGLKSKVAFVFWCRDKVMSASSSAANFPAENAGFQNTYAEWKPASSGNNWLQIDMGSVQPVDSVGVANHTIATSGIGSVSIATSADGSSWSAVGSVETITNEDFIALFPAVNCRYVRLFVNGPAPTIGVLQAAKRLDFRCPAVLSYTPIQHSKTYDKEFNNSVDGQFLTNRTISRGAQTSANLLMQEASFVDVAMIPFESHYNQGGCFFYGGAPLHMPKDMGYCQAGGENDIVGVDYIAAGTMANVSFSINVFIGA